MVLISTDLGYITRLHQIDSGQSWESLSGFKEERLTGNDLQMATSGHRKNGILLITDHSDYSCRSDNT